MRSENPSEVRRSLIRAGVATCVVCALLCLSSCGGGGTVPVFPPPIVTQILSDPRLDGDIEQIAPGSYVVTQGMSPSIQSVLAGTDPTALTEFRAFLNFPLGGSGGVPINAIIDSAFVEVLINNVIPLNGSVSIRVELVAFQPPTLIGTDFDRAILPPLGAVLIEGLVTAADMGHFVPVDVTPLMVQAQQRGLASLQLRILEDLGPTNFTLIEIDDSITAARPQRAPLLTVTYH